MAGVPEVVTVPLPVHAPLAVVQMGEPFNWELVARKLGAVPVGTPLTLVVTAESIELIPTSFTRDDPSKAIPVVTPKI